MHKILLLMCAGAVGTAARYVLAGLVQRQSDSYLPWGTLAVNITGCFAAGLLWMLFEERWAIPAEARTIVLVGFMGAFTTFSAYILESGLMLRTSDWFGALLYFMMQNGVGILALFAGMMTAKAV